MILYNSTRKFVNSNNVPNILPNQFQTDNKIETRKKERNEILYINLQKNTIKNDYLKILKKS